LEDRLDDLHLRDRNGHLLDQRRLGYLDDPLGHMRLEKWHFFVDVPHLRSDDLGDGVDGLHFWHLDRALHG